MAASTLGVPIVLLNADAAPLMSTTLLKPLASGVLCGFDGEAAAKAGEKGLVTGNPVRPEIAAVPPPAQRFLHRSGPYVVHQCGATHLEAVQAAYRTAGVEAEIVPFIEDMGARYAAADVVLARAGAITVTELAAAGVPSILVPLVVSTTNHQHTNAEFMAARNAAIHLPQSDLTAERLAGLLTGLERPKLLAMAEAARAVGKPKATETVATVIERVAA
jgi:UDP-N-acetylglucosamine--N-acetylmuramyl-(pentapeptide) pyrophosphoryl-undecaprenol N-acetylglucosamine transferase